MARPATLAACRTCGFASPPGTSTCPYCGVDPAYVDPTEHSGAVDAAGQPVVRLPLRDAVMSGVVVTGGGALVAMVAWVLFRDLFEDVATLGQVVRIALPLVALGVVALFDLLDRNVPRRAKTGTLREAETRLDVALSDAHARRDRLDALERHAPAVSEHGAATQTLADAAHVLDARLATLHRARFDLRLVWWKNRVDLALARLSSGEASAHDTFTALAALRDEAARALDDLGPDPGPDRADAYADVRPRLGAAHAALGTFVARVFDASVAEAVAGIAAPLSEASAVRAEVDVALDALAAVAEAAPAAARADALTRESVRLSLERDDLAGAPPDDEAAPLPRRMRA